MSLKGSFAPPGDKSISHRIGLLALLARGRCAVKNYSSGQDCASTLAAAELLGVGVDRQGDRIVLHGAGGSLAGRAEVDCGNSGTTMRLLMGILAGHDGEYVLDGDESLRRRPMERVAAPLRLMGGAVDCPDGRPPVSIRGGGLTGVTYDMPVASAQLKSALLFAGVQADGTTAVKEPAVSRDHTERMLAMAGANIEQTASGWRVRRSELSLPPELWVPGDPSSAAFFLCAAAVMPGSQVTAEAISLNPTRIGFVDVLKRMGVDLQEFIGHDQPEPWGRITVRHSPGLKGCMVWAKEIPLLVDEVPILALVATQAEGVTVFKGVGELRVKETDRLEAIISQLGAFGADLRAVDDDLLVHGPTRLAAPAEADSLGDHRMAMTLRLAGLLCGAEPRIAHEDCVAISYPGFGDTLKDLAR